MLPRDLASPHLSLTAWPPAAPPLAVRCSVLQACALAALAAYRASLAAAAAGPGGEEEGEEEGEEDLPARLDASFVTTLCMLLDHMDVAELLQAEGAMADIAAAVVRMLVRRWALRSVRSRALPHCSCWLRAAQRGPGRRRLLWSGAQRWAAPSCTCAARDPPVLCGLCRAGRALTPRRPRLSAWPAATATGEGLGLHPAAAHTYCLAPQRLMAHCRRPTPGVPPPLHPPLLQGGAEHCRAAGFC